MSIEITKDKTVADFVTNNIKTAHIFKKYGIDFCCGGGVTLDEACKQCTIDKAILEKELLEVDYVSNAANNYDKWDLDFLIDYIINVHHNYVNESLPILSEYANKVAKVHGHYYTEVIKINKLFHDVANELVSHLQKEEQVLFPFIKRLVKMEKEGETDNPFVVGTVKNPIQMMEHEHEKAGATFKIIAALTNNYTPPEGICNTFKAFYAKLEEFEQDLHHHIHLENNILHTKAIALEKKIFG